jgi:hypothetical protein
MTLPRGVADLVGRLSIRPRRRLLASSWENRRSQHESNRPTNNASVESRGHGLRVRWIARRVRAVSCNGLCLPALRLPDARRRVREARQLSRVRHDVDPEAGTRVVGTEKARLAVKLITSECEVISSRNRLRPACAGARSASGRFDREPSRASPACRSCASTAADGCRRTAAPRTGTPSRSASTSRDSRKSRCTA